jgi:hypothetical protein
VPYPNRAPAYLVGASVEPQFCCQLIGVGDCGIDRIECDLDSGVPDIALVGALYGSDERVARDRCWVDVSTSPNRSFFSSSVLDCATQSRASPAYCRN